VVWIVAGRAGTVWSRDVLERLQALTHAVFTIPGVIAPDVVSLASANLRDVRVTDGELTPVYLLGDLPRDANAMRALRRRVDTDPLLRGSLVSLDGRAAMVVANFRADADAATIAAHALALRDRFRDDVTHTWVTGAPVLALTAPASIKRSAPRIAGVMLVLIGIGMALIGVRRVLAAALACLTVGMMTAAVASAGFEATLPWSVLAAVPTGLAAASLAAAPSWPTPMCLALLGLGPTFPMWMLATGDDLLRPFALALAAGFLVGPLVALLLRRVFVIVPEARRAALPSHVVALFVLGTSFGIARLELDLHPFGLGLRYLPAAAADDLGALARHFPPPTTFAVRIHGDPGVVARPEVLRALERITATTGGDPAVQSATSLADLVRRVHKTFNDERPEFDRIPDDRALISRYLALAYSPGFRRYVDRPLATTAIWIMVRRSASLADVRRVHDTLSNALWSRPIPTGLFDPPAGDGVALLRYAWAAEALVRAAIAALVITAGLCVLVIPAAQVGCACLAATAALLATIGMLGWMGLALDLFTIPASFALALATFDWQVTSPTAAWFRRTVPSLAFP
jgi:hypothetical protein